jgi:NADH dehydrogenase [ubiquinone] 1 alpha subcomplex assembly factor 3
MSAAMQQLPRMLGRFSAVPLSTPRLALLAQARSLQPPATTRRRAVHTTPIALSTTTLPNILAGGPTPPVVVKRMTERGLQLADGLIIPGPCIFLEGEVLLWDVPEADKWENMSEKEIRERFEVFEVVVPRPGE